VEFSSPALDPTRERLLARFGARVEPWWERLPGVLAELAERWEPVVEDAVGGRGNTSLVVRCRRADGRVVSLAERIEFIFEHWIERHARRGGAVTRAVPVDRLRRGHPLARALVADGGAPVLLHGDLHPGNVLDGGAARGLVAIDPRRCVGGAAFDTVDWVFWRVDEPSGWQPRSSALARTLGADPERVWAWCAAVAALLAASRAARGAAADEVAAPLALGP
jgi:streptomycin 6-kinase